MVKRVPEFRNSKSDKTSAVDLKQFLEHCSFISKREEFAELALYSNQFIRRHPTESVAWNILGFANKNLGQLDEALGAFEEAIKLKKNFKEARLNLAITYEELGQLANAVEHYIFLAVESRQNIRLLSKIGLLHRKLGQLEDSTAAYNAALKVCETDPQIHNSLGLTQLKMGKTANALASFNKAIKFNPNYIQSWNNLGNTYKNRGDMQKAAACYQRAILINKEYSPAKLNLAQMHRDKKCYQDSYKLLQTIKTRKSLAQSLECLFLDGKHAQYLDELKKLVQTDKYNIRVAALSAFASHQLKINDSYPFCPNPINFLQIESVFTEEFSIDQLQQTLDFLNFQNAEWEPEAKTTMNGFQTANTLFEETDPLLTSLEAVIRQKIGTYRQSFSGNDCSFISDWPKQFSLSAWYVRLIKGGHQDSHIHPAGWLSGVLYLKTIDDPVSNEGAIKFGLRGFDYTVFAEDPPHLIHQPKVGDIALFPSSLFHETIPVIGDHERSVLAFDVVPTG